MKRLIPVGLDEICIIAGDATVDPVLRTAYGELDTRHDIGYWKSEFYSKQLQAKGDAGLLLSSDAASDIVTPITKEGDKSRKRKYSNETSTEIPKLHSSNRKIMRGDADHTPKIKRETELGTDKVFVEDPSTLIQVSYLEEVSDLKGPRNGCQLKRAGVERSKRSPTLNTSSLCQTIT